MSVSRGAVFEADRWALLARQQTTAEQAVYDQLYAESWGRGRPTAQISQVDLAKRCGIAARKTVRSALEGLHEKGHIRIPQATVHLPASQDATEYQVRLTGDILGDGPIL